METTSKMKCEFKPLPGERWKRFMGHYAVSSEGRFASALRPGKGERVRSFRLRNPDGKDRVGCVDGEGNLRFFRVHNLVLRLFGGKCPECGRE